MSNHFSTDTVLLLLVLLVVFIPVLQSSKAPRKFATANDQYQKASIASAAAARDYNHHRRSEHAKAEHYRNGVYSQRQHNMITEERLQGTLLKTKTTREEARLYNNAAAKTNTGKSYRKKYPTQQPHHHHYYDTHEIANGINRKPEKYYYSKDLKKHRSHHPRPSGTSDDHVEVSPSRETTITVSKAVHPTAESSLPDQGEDSALVNLSPQIDFDISNDMSNSSFSNESSIYNNGTEPVVKSKYEKCLACQMREGDKQYRIERLKQTILSSLRMKHPPNTTRMHPPKIPAMVKYYGMDDTMMNDSPYTKRNDDDDDYIIRTERVFTKARLPPAKDLLNITDSVYFAPPISLYTSKIKTAYLWFYIRKRSTRRSFIHLTIERILAESVPEKRLVTKTIFADKLRVDRAHGWKRIDLREILRRWVTHPMSNLGIQIRAFDDQGNNLVVLTPAPEMDKGYEPWLDTKVIEPRTNSNSRHKRSNSLECDEHSVEPRCCRYRLDINFSELGWEWIIAPTITRADYCSGECHMTMQNTSPIGYIHQQLPGLQSGSCCSPSKLGPLPLLYFDEDYNVLYQILQGMKVLKCGCT